MRDTFIWFEGINGPVQVKDYKDCIEVESFSNGGNQSVSSEPNKSRYAGTAIIGDFVINIDAGLSTPTLFQSLCNGHVFTNVELKLTYMVEKERKTYMTYKFENVILSGYSISGASGQKAMETLSLNFATINIDYADDDDKDGKGWNILTDSEL